MQERISLLHTWNDFYVIVGSSAAALTGLMFVVITLVAGVRARSTREGIAAFSTPTVVHFCVALLIGSAITAPWPTLACIAGVLSAAGLLGLGYSVWVVMRQWRQTDYEPDAEDVVCYTVLPLVLYAVLLAGGIAVAFRPAIALFVIAGVALGFIFLGIHNAWDVVTYVGLQRLTRQHDEQHRMSSHSGEAASAEQSRGSV